MAEDELCKAIALAEAQLDVRYHTSSDLGLSLLICNKQVFEGRNSSVGSSPTASPSISPFDTPRVFDTPRAMEHVFSANGKKKSARTPLSCIEKTIVKNDVSVKRMG